MSGPNRRRWLAWLAACAGVPAAVAARSAGAAEPAYETARWPQGQPTPDFELTDSAGRKWTLAQARGKVVILNFWATWCEPCRAEMPSLQQAADLYAPELLVLAVNFKERDASVTRFARSAGLSLALPMDRDGEVAARYGVKVFPSSILIARDGKARLRVTGEVDWTGRQAAGWIDSLVK